MRVRYIPPLILVASTAASHCQASPLIGGTLGGDRLISVDRDTAVGVELLALERDQTPHGLGFDKRTGWMFVVDSGSDWLSRVNLVTGESIYVHNFGSSNVNGLAVNARTREVYATDVEANRLYTLDADSGEVLRESIVPDGIEGLGFDARRSILYGVDDLQNRIITIDPVSGEIENVLTGLPDIVWRGLDFDHYENVLYATGIATGHLYRIELESQPVLVDIGALNYPGGGAMQGMAFVPAPATCTIICLGVAVTRKRGRRQT